MSSVPGHSASSTTNQAERTRRKGFEEFNPSVAEQVADPEAEQARRRGQAAG